MKRTATMKREAALLNARIEVLDADFQAAGQIIESGNVRVIFGSGAAIDLFVDESDRLIVNAVKRDHFNDQLMLVGAGRECCDFEISMRSTFRDGEER